jgi:hypothetical protein
MKIQTKPKPAGPVFEAVQFLGDPSVAPKWIYWCPEEDIGRGCTNKAHWRCGGESHGGPYDSSSSWLEIGDWLYKCPSTGEIRIVHPDQFERDWQLAEIEA